MLSTVNIIAIAKDALAMREARFAGVVPTSALQTALADAETARAEFADYRNRVSVALLAIERTLESGDSLASHGFHDEQYSKVTSSCQAARFRNAMRELETAHAEFLTAISQHIAGLRRFRASA